MAEGKTWIGYKLRSGQLNYTCLICFAQVSPLVNDLNRHREWHEAMAALHTFKEPDY